jgi:hypothetical protein
MLGFAIKLQKDHLNKQLLKQEKILHINFIIAV